MKFTITNILGASSLTNMKIGDNRFWLTLMNNWVLNSHCLIKIDGNSESLLFRVTKDNDANMMKHIFPLQLFGFLIFWWAHTAEMGTRSKILSNTNSKHISFDLTSSTCTCQTYHLTISNGDNNPTTQFIFHFSSLVSYVS